MSNPLSNPPITSSDPSLFVVVGAGQIGPLVTERLRSLGHRVRVVRRSAGARGPAGVEQVSADLMNPAEAARALRGAQVVIHCATPRYHQWGQELLPMTRGILSGAKEAGARLVALDNLYMYGTPPGGRMREDSPSAPRSKKGALRAAAAEELLSAGTRGELPVILGRAADFVGPGARLAAIFGDRFWSRLMDGKSVEYFGDADQPHSYSYVPDVAAGLVTLATTADPAVWNRVWHLPVNAAESTRVWIERFASAAGRSPSVSKMPGWMLAMVGLFIPEAGEVREMQYQWEGPFILDDTAFRTRFGASPTGVPTIVRETLAWAEETYGPKANYGLAAKKSS